MLNFQKNLSSVIEMFTSGDLRQVKLIFSKSVLKNMASDRRQFIFSFVDFIEFFQAGINDLFTI